MANDLLMRLLVMNVAAALAILAVLVLRKPSRAAIGAQRAYALWLIVPTVMLATLLPPRTVLIPAPPSPILAPAVATTPDADAALIAMQDMPVPHALPATAPTAAIWPRLDLSQAIVGVWLFGMAVSLILLAIGQRRATVQFGRLIPDVEDPRLARATNPRVGPALVGTLRPRVILPADFEARFDAREQAMVLAHERTHLARGHAAINAFVALTRAVHWFNPLLHLAARLARIDQELACDAAVMERFPGDRQAYAQALLKTQLTFATLPLGCDWPSRSPSRLEERIKMLAQDKLGRLRMRVGAGLVAALTTGAGLAAWAAEPPVAKLVPTAFPVQITGVADRSAPQVVARATVASPAPGDLNQADTSSAVQSVEAGVSAQPSTASLSAPAAVEPPQTVELVDGQALVQAPVVPLTSSSPRPIELAEARVPTQGSVAGGAPSTTLQPDAARDGVHPLREAVAAPVAPADLDRYVGYYQMERYLVMHVSRRGDGLRTGFISSQSDVALVPAGGTTFTTLEGLARITFTLDAKGDATGLVWRQGAKDWRAPRIERNKARTVEWSRRNHVGGLLPSAGTREFLDHLLHSVEAGAPDYSAMSPTLAAEASRDHLASQIKPWGALKSIKFLGTTLEGHDAFTAVFQHSRVDFVVSPLNPEGKVQDLALRSPAPVQLGPGGSLGWSPSPPPA